MDGDALATNRSDIFVGVKTADCTPILIGDPSSGVAAAIHAGWRGALGRIVEKTLARLKNQHGFNAQNAIAAVGPSACVDCYEVGPEVEDVFKKEFSYGSILLQKKCLDVPQANVRQLIDSGVSPANIYVSQYCTMRDTNLFFSHRREGNNPQRRAVGRLLSVIGKQ
jgi:YfiH family protein